MWTEKRPNENDTVMVEFADWTKLGTMIGVFLRYSGGRAIVDFGSRNMWLDIYTPFYVFESE